MRELASMRSLFKIAVAAFALNYILPFAAAGQQIIKGRSKPAAFNITPSETVVERDTTRLTVGTTVELYKNEKKTALVIGNGTYTSVPLRNAVNDALDMAATLSEKGFNVILRKDATRAEMREAIREFGGAINQGGVGLFYYSGHGLQVDGVNYLVPIDANVQIKAEVAEECISAATVLRVMEYSNNRINIIILDACRNSPFRGFSRSDEKGITRMDPPKGSKQGSIIAFATAPGDVASDGDGRNGFYTSKLLKYINVPGLTLEEVFKKVRIEVSSESKGTQIPWENNSLTGDFFFNVK